MNDKYTAQAGTQEEAINQGLNALGITRDEAIITIEEPGKKGFLGIGQKDAVVVVERKEKIDIVDEFLSNEFEDQQLSSSTRSNDKTKQQDKSIDEEDDEKIIEKEEKAEREESEMDATEFSEGRDPAEVEIVEEQKENEKITDEKSDAKQDDEEAIEAVRLYLKEIIQAMDISDVEVYISRVKNNIKYDIETESAGMVIGRHGKVLNGLQTLAQNHMHQLAHSKLYVRVDAEKYRERRRNTVESLAERTADKVIKTNKAVKLNPMPAHERKQIHRYLNGNPKIKTHSEGREPKRYLVVTPEE